MTAISDKVRDARDLTEVMYAVPEWDVKLLLISPTVQERLDMVEQFTVWTEDVDGNRVGNVDRVAMGPSLVIACAHDPEARERAFVEADLAMLKGKNGAVVENIAKACFPLVGFSTGNETATDPGKDDSSTTPSGGTESPSPADSAAR